MLRKFLVPFLIVRPIPEYGGFEIGIIWILEPSDWGVIL
jgi:hypothetical protein